MIAALAVSGIVMLWAVVRSLFGGRALIVDCVGIALRSPRLASFGSARRTVDYRWDDVIEVVLFAKYLVHRGMTQRFAHIGVRVRPEAQGEEMAYDPGSLTWSMARKDLPHVPEDVLARSAPVVGWQLDEHRLCDAVNLFAPDVRVVTLDQTGRPRPLCPREAQAT